MTFFIGKPPKPSAHVPDCPCPKCGSPYAVIEFRRAKVRKRSKSFWSFFVGQMPGMAEVVNLPDRIHMECSTCGHQRWVRPMDHQNRQAPSAVRDETQAGQQVDRSVIPLFPGRHGDPGTEGDGP